MKILQVNVCYGNASTGRIVMELAEYLDKDGNDCKVAYSYGINTRTKDIKIGNVIDRKCHAIMSRLSGMQGYYSKTATKKLIKRIKEFNPDVVHLHNLHSNNLNFKKLFNYLAKEKVSTVITLHDCFFFTGKCCHYTIANCCKWEKSCGNCPQLKNDNPSLFFDKTEKLLIDKKQYFDSLNKLCVIGVSDWITNEARKSPIFNENVIFKRIYNWIDTNIFNIEKHIEKNIVFENKFNILCVASEWSDKKGLNFVLSLSKILKDDEQIIMVGKIDNNVILPNNVINLPNTDDVAELVKIYNTADVFLNPSMEESFGKVTAEALACGTPVIVMNSTASPELVGDGCGYVNKSFTIEESYKCITEIRNNGKQYYSKNCRDYAVNKFNKNKLITEQCEVYAKVKTEGIL